ncbi:MAG: thioredoxin family protein [Planctomycetota bacterium]
MRLTRPIALLGLVAWTAPSLARAEEPAAPAALTVTVPTEVVPAPKPSDPPPAKGSEPRVSVMPVTVELADGAPAGVTPPAGANAWHGDLEVGGKKLPFGVVCATGATCAVYVDANRDGALDPATEKVEAPVTASPDGSVTARLEKARLGGAEIVVTLQRRPAGFSGMLGRPPVGGKPAGPARPLEFTAAPPADPTHVADLKGTVRYATVTDGDATFHVAAARDGDAGLVVLVDEKPDFGTARRVTPNGGPMRRGSRVVGMRWTAAGFSLGGVPRVLNVQETVDNAWAMVTPAATRKGAADVEGKPYVLYLLDGDLDGAYRSPEDAWWFGPKGALANPNVNNMTEGDAPQLLEGGLVWTLEGLADDGSARLVRSSRPDAADEVLHRRAERVNAKRWFPRFAEDKDFDKAHPADPARKPAEKPLRFRFALTLDDAKALAAKEGKPLLVDFEADWCVWCKRLDYHTYPDAGVVKALERFTCVKINNELDPKKSCNGLGWRGIPAVGVFGADGKPVVFKMPGRDGHDGPVVDHIPGFQMPQDFVATLDAVHAAYEDVKAGKPPLTLPPPKAPEAPRPPAVPTAPLAPEKPATPPAPSPTPTPTEPAPQPQPGTPEPAPTK